ncbi:MAG: ABC transporter permease subunit [Christensenellales bacterium]|jgi:ribose transport system permease protein
MKRIRILGGVALALAAAVIAIGLFANVAKSGDGALAGALLQARATQTRVDANARAVRNAAALARRAQTADAGVVSARAAVDRAAEEIAALDQAAEAHTTGDEMADALRDIADALIIHTDDARAAAPEAAQALLTALDALEDGALQLDAMATARVLSLYQAIVLDAHDAVSGAEESLDGVREGAARVYELIEVEFAPEEIVRTQAPTLDGIDACREALILLDARAAALEAQIAQVDAWAEDANRAALDASKLALSLRERAVIALSDNFIGVLFTAVLLLLIGSTLLFFAEPFKRQWSKNPTFSVGIALIAMLIFQTYALGFGQGSLAQWGKFWFDNTFNVLRANTSVGMIALGMTLVIITGGIDLAVGSTLAGVGTVLMAMIDTGKNGALVKLGITGYPAFAIGILVALAVGAAIGAVIGLLVTKGRIPPFIVTLGVMNIVRSVSQYFTKSYTPTVPKAFEAVANTMVFGQRPMTILYWLALAVLFYLMMRHTAFGRYVYAVGSNERTTRLSGIDTDKVKIKVYVLTGLVVAIAAVSQLSRLGGMDVASAGTGYELDAIAAVVVGGTAMSGGRGSIAGTVLGVLIIGIMNNLLILLGVDSFLTDAFKGAIVVFAVLMQRKEARG